MNQEMWPLAGIYLKTIIKILGCDLFHHEGTSPYFQISIDGFILSSFGDVMLANVQINIEEEDAANVNAAVEAYLSETVHWLESTNFSIIGGTYHFYEPTMAKIDTAAEINEFFPISIARNREAGKGEFWYAGVVYKPGKGELAYGTLPWVK